MTTDTVKLTERFRKFCQEWDLQSGEADMQAQNKALIALHDWLRTGVNSPEVVIRAVQVLMADPETPGIRKRHAVDQVFSQISAQWGAAGLKNQDVLILQGMILAAWPQDLRDGGFALTPLLESPWVAIHGKGDSAPHITNWRSTQSATTHLIAEGGHTPPPIELPKPTDTLKPLKAQDYSSQIETIPQGNSHYSQELGIKTFNVINLQQKAISSVIDQVNIIQKHINQLNTNANKTAEHLAQTVNFLEQSTKNLAKAEQQNLLWWGQARYSTTLRHSYRRITNKLEQLWWMAWESSELSVNLEVEPSACFLVETLYQLTPSSEDRKRPLKEWLGEFIDVLRRIRDEDKHGRSIAVSTQLEQVAKKDALGLPVTWARIEAANPRPSVRPIAERIREHCAVDPETEIDLGDWAAWLFREALLDRRLGAK